MSLPPHSPLHTELAQQPGLGTLGVGHGPREQESWHSADAQRKDEGTQRSEAERRRLLAAATVVLQRRGDFKVGSVLRQAGLSTRSFYRHFETKNDLVLTLLEEGLGDIAVMLRRATAAADTPLERAHTWVRTTIGIPYRQDMAKRARMYAMNLRNLRSEYPEAIERCVEITRAPLVDALAEGSACGQLHSDDPLADATAIFRLVTSMTADQAVTLGAVPREEIERAVMPFVSRAIKLG